MRLMLNDAVLVGKKETTSKDGQTTYYNLTVEQDGDVYPFGCTEDVARMVEKYKSYDFMINYSKFEWNGSTRTSMRIVEVAPTA